MQLAEVEQRGFAVLPEVFTRSEVERHDESLRRDPLSRSRAGMRHALKHPAIQFMAHDPRLQAIARGVLGCDPFPSSATLFDKPAVSNWLVVRHQDTALPRGERHEIPQLGPRCVEDGVIYGHAVANAPSGIVAPRFDLDDSGSENGPLRVLPATHRMGVLTGERIQGLSTQQPVVDYRVRRDGIAVLRTLRIHASSKSRSTGPRRMLQIRSAASASVPDGPELAAA